MADISVETPRPIIAEDLISVKTYVNAWGGKDGIVLVVVADMAKIKIDEDNTILRLPVRMLEHRKAKTKNEKAKK